MLAADERKEISMLLFRHCIVLLIVAGGAEVGFAQKGNPTFSLEAVSVNGISILNGPVQSITASPGDIITAHLLARNWSPASEKLRAYQISIDEHSYITGTSGMIRPNEFNDDFANPVENLNNAFIDDQHPQYILRGRKNISIVDSVSPGYRYLGTLMNAPNAIVCPVAGKKYYGGTIRFLVSDNAAGDFTLRIKDQPVATMLQDTEGQAIIPLDFEHLSIKVVGVLVQMIMSHPAPGSIDARQPSKLGSVEQGGTPGSWDRIRFDVKGDPSQLVAEDFIVNDGTPTPPKIQKVDTDDDTVTIVLDRGISRGEWTTITHKKSNTGTRVGWLPGDTDGDGVLHPDDIIFLTRFVAGVAELNPPLLPHRTDVDRSGGVSVPDALRVLDLLNEPHAYRARLSQ